MIIKIALYIFITLISIDTKVRYKKMKKRNKIIITIIFSTILVAILGYLVVGNPVVLINNHKLENSIKSIQSDNIKLNEVVPFDWDIVYTFEPYTSKENIEEIIGFKSSAIKENNINEGMVHLLFVKGEKVVASILGYSTNLGYSLDLTSKITFVENAQFNVSIINNIVTLKCLDE